MLTLRNMRVIPDADVEPGVDTICIVCGRARPFTGYKATSSLKRGIRPRKRTTTVVDSAGRPLSVCSTHDLKVSTTASVLCGLSELRQMERDHREELQPMNTNLRRHHQ